MMLDKDARESIKIIDSDLKLVNQNLHKGVTDSKLANQILSSLKQHFSTNEYFGTFEQARFNNWIDFRKAVLVNYVDNLKYIKNSIKQQLVDLQPESESLVDKETKIESSIKVLKSSHFKWWDYANNTVHIANLYDVQRILYYLRKCFNPEVCTYPYGVNDKKIINEKPQL